MPVHAARRLAAYRRQHVVAGRQAHEQRERHQPHAQAEVWGDHGEARDVGVFVVGPLVGAVLAAGEVAEPDVVVDQDEDCTIAGLGVELREVHRWVLTDGENEEGVGQPDKGELSHVAQVDDVGDDAQHSGPER